MQVGLWRALALCISATIRREGSIMPPPPRRAPAEGARHLALNMCECLQILGAAAHATSHWTRDPPREISLRRALSGESFMKLSRLFGLSLTAVDVLQAAPALAQTPGTGSGALPRLVLADDGKPESGKYFFQTRGQAAGATARAELNYSTGISARAAAYPTEAKDLLNPYSSLTLSIGHFTPGDGKSKPTVGAVSFGAIGKDFSAIPGAPITLKLVVDGVSFGPYEPAPVSSGMYSVWLDTADTDGDGKPPRLDPAEFAKLAKAIRRHEGGGPRPCAPDGADLVRATIPSPNFVAWRDGLPSAGPPGPAPASALQRRARVAATSCTER